MILALDQLLEKTQVAALNAKDKANVAALVRATTNAGFPSAAYQK